MTTLHASTCVVCAKRPPEWSLTCAPCRNRMRDQLRELVDEYALLDATPGASTGQRVSGTRTAPLPVRVDVLNLVGPGSAAVSDPHGDQTGELPTRVWMATWCDDWAEIRGEYPPPADVPTMARWMDHRLDWAADEHKAIEEFADELKAQLGALRAANQTREPKPEPLVTPCPSCRLRSLVRVNGGDVHCQACGRILRPDEYDQHVTVAVLVYQEASCTANTPPGPASTAPC